MTLQQFFTEDAKEPCPDLGSSLESVQGFQEDDEDILHSILSFALRQPHAYSGAKQRPGVIAHDNFKRLGFPAAEAVQELRLYMNVRRHLRSLLRIVVRKRQ